VCLVDKKHELLKQLKEVRNNINHIPSMVEFTAITGTTRNTVRYHFGNWATFINNIESVVDKDERKEQLKKLFHADINKTLKTPIKQPLFINDSNVKDIVCFSDTHFPFSSQATLEHLYTYLKENKNDITHFFLLGDLYDMFAHTKFPRSMNVYTPKDEMNIGYEMAEEMFNKIQEIVPGIQIFLCSGNHDMRPLKRILASYPEGEIFFSTEKFYTFEGVNYIEHDKEFEFLNMNFLHGYGTRPGQHMNDTLKCTAVGHSHTGGTVFRKTSWGIIWELNCGYAGDETSKVFGYKALKCSKWTNGLGVIKLFNGVRFPFFLPLA